MVAEALSGGRHSTFFAVPRRALALEGLATGSGRAGSIGQLGTTMGFPRPSATPCHSLYESARSEPYCAGRLVIASRASRMGLRRSIHATLPRFCASRILFSLSFRYIPLGQSHVVSGSAFLVDPAAGAGDKQAAVGLEIRLAPRRRIV